MFPSISVIKIAPRALYHIQNMFNFTHIGLLTLAFGEELVLLTAILIGFVRIPIYPNCQMKIVAFMNMTFARKAGVKQESTNPTVNEL